MKKFGLIFFYALLGGVMYELILYFFENQALEWSNVILQVVGIALIISIILSVIRDYMNRKSEEKKEKRRE